MHNSHFLLDATGAGALFGAAYLIYRDLPHGPRVAGREERRLRAAAYRRMAALITVGLSLLVGGIR